MKINLIKVIIISTAALMFYGSALATVGNPTESALRNEHVQTMLKNNHGAHAQAAWSHMSDTQKQTAKEKENQRLHKIGSYKQMERQEGMVTSTSSATH